MSTTQIETGTSTDADIRESGSALRVSTWTFRGGIKLGERRLTVKIVNPAINSPAMRVQIPQWVLFAIHPIWTVLLFVASIVGCIAAFRTNAIVYLPTAVFAAFCFALLAMLEMWFLKQVKKA